MTTLLQEFEEWLEQEYESSDNFDLEIFIVRAKGKLEELKKKHNISNKE